ncbi:DUF4386 domain-containing protein [Roseivivax sp. CAU 1753]
MPTQPITRAFVRQARWAGLLYLVIIVTGLGAELGLRASLIDLDDAAATAEAILGAPGLFRASLAADLIMALADAGLAILLYLMFRAAAPALALSAMVFRLIQTALIAANLMTMQTAWLLLDGAADIPVDHARSLARVFLELHGQGYDLGLVFFGVNSLIMGHLVWRSGLFARAFGLGLVAAGLVYLIGSGLRFLAPDLSALFMPAYGITILAESAFCLRLLLQRRPRPAS